MSCSCCSQADKAKTFEPFIDRFALSTECRLDNGLKQFKMPTIGPESENWGSSNLQSLPVELYQACLSYLDVATITAMRRVSQYTRHAIDTLYQYQELYEHAPQALRACLSTGVASHVPLRRLHHSLTTMECHYCTPLHHHTPGDHRWEHHQCYDCNNGANCQKTFGGYLSLYEGYRSCLFCLRNNPALKPIELMTLITLRSQSNSQIRHIDNTPILSTLPGSYFPWTNTPPRHARRSLLRAQSISLFTSGRVSEKEHLALYGNTKTTPTIHHPLISPSSESDVDPPNYVPPETFKQIAQLYMSAIAFPYLPSSKNVADYGVLCADCCLKMRYEEQRWMDEQASRRMNGQDPAASARTRDRICGARKRACRMFCVSEEARKDDERRNEYGIVEAEPMSIQLHKLTHVKEKMSRGEVEWRKSIKGPPLPLLRHDRFG